MRYDFVARFPNVSSRSQAKTFVMPLTASPQKGEHHRAEPAKRKHREDVMYHREAREFLVVKIHTSVISS